VTERMPIGDFARATGSRKRAKGGRSRRYDGMSPTERRYAGHLEMLRLEGHILGWWFERVRLVLAPKRDGHREKTLTIDFLVQLFDGSLELHDVKGTTRSGKKPAPWVEGDAKEKARWATEIFPFPIRYAYEADGEWKLKEVG
jgi:hypothetical protein